MREALAALLDGARVLRVREGERELGTLSFDDVRAAIAAGAA